MNYRYISVSSDTNLYRLLDALDDVGIYYDIYGHTQDITIVKINVGKMWKTYNDAATDVMA